MLRVDEDVPRSRRVHIATFCRLSSTLFHHAPATALAVRAVPIAVVEATKLTSLMSKTSVAEASAAGLVSAKFRAVPIAVVASGAQEKDLSARHRPTNHEAKRLHVPDGEREKTCSPERARANYRSTTTSRSSKARCSSTGPSSISPSLGRSHPTPARSPNSRASRRALTARGACARMGEVHRLRLVPRRDIRMLVGDGLGVLVRGAF